jgi:subtilisin
MAGAEIRVAPVTPSITKGKVLSRIGDGEALLVRIPQDERLRIQREHPGMLVVPEGRATMAFARFDVLPIPMGTMAGGGPRARRTVVVRVRDGAGKPLKHVPLVLLTDLTTTPPTGAESVTDAKGSSRFPLPHGTKVARVQAMPAWGYWWASETPSGNESTYTLVCGALDPAAKDGLRALYTPGGTTDGQGVTVAVVDGGVGPHPSLELEGGANLVDGEADAEIKDNGVGHGTHVAGIIAARAGAKTPGGLAPGVRLLSFRVYAKSSSTAGSFAVAGAIRKAVEQGADLINLSLVLDNEQPEVSREIQRALAKGVVCVAAAGNDAGPVGVPARFNGVLAVSAVGVRGSWPNNALDSDLRAKPRSRRDRRLAIAGFSNFGPQIDFTAPGVGIVSTLPRSRIGVMRGTSMAAPAVTGLLARELGKQAVLLGADRDRRRADGILTLARSLATRAGFGAQYEGYGLLR